MRPSLGERRLSALLHVGQVQQQRGHPGAVVNQRVGVGDVTLAYSIPENLRASVSQSGGGKVRR